MYTHLCTYILEHGRVLEYLGSREVGLLGEVTFETAFFLKKKKKPFYFLLGYNRLTML